MKTLENRIPPPLVAVICGFFMWWVSDGLVHPAEVSGLRVFAALVVLVGGGIFCLAGVIAFRSAQTTVNPLKPGSASSLVKTGVYRISRNPMYLGFALFLVSWAIYLGSFWAAFGILGFVLFINRFQIVPEERAMMSLFGSEFEAYSSAVRRWI